MRKRSKQEMIITRCRRIDTIYDESNFSSQASDSAEFNVMETQDRWHYFQDQNNENADFSHNAIIKKQLLVRSMQGDYFKFLDVSQENQLQLRNQATLMQFNSSTPMSILLNIRIDDSEHLQGIWFSRETAITLDGSTILFAECYITKELQSINIQIIQYALLLQDQLFITCINGGVQTILHILQIFEQLETISTVFYPRVNKLVLAALPQSELIKVEQQLYLYVDSIEFVAQFPGKLIEFEWQYFDYKNNIDGQKYGQNVNLSVRLYLDYMIQLLRNCQFSRVQLMYKQVISLEIQSIIQASLYSYEFAIQKQLFPQLPTTNIYDLLNQRRLTLIDTIYSGTVQFWSFSDFIKQNKALRQIIQQKESNLIQVNNQMYECIMSQAILEQRRLLQLKCHETSQLLVDQFISQINLFVQYCSQLEGLDHIRFAQITMFFRRQYPAFLKDFLHKVGAMIDLECDTHFQDYSEYQTALKQRAIILTQKLESIKQYNETLRLEISNLTQVTTSFYKQLQGRRDLFIKQIQVENHLQFKTSQTYQLQLKVTKMNKVFFLKRTQTAGNGVRGGQEKDIKAQTFTQITALQEYGSKLHKQLNALKSKDKELNELIEAKEARILELRNLKILKNKKDNFLSGGEARQSTERVDKLRKMKRNANNIQFNIDFLKEKENEHLSQKVKFKKEIDAFRKEKMMFQKICEGLKIELTKKQEIMQQKELEQESKLQSLHQQIQASHEQRNFQSQEQKKFTGEYKSIYDKFKKENKRNEQNDNILNRDDDDFGSDTPHMFFEESANNKKKKLQEKEKQVQQQGEQVDQSFQRNKKKLENYDYTLKQLMDQTKAQQFDEIVNTFQDYQEANYGAFKYINELTDDLEFLQKQNKLLRAELDELIKRPEKIKEDPKYMEQERIKKQIKVVKIKQEDYNNQHQEISKILKELRISIPNMFDRIGCGQKEYMAQLGANFTFRDMDEDQIIRVLGVIEVRTNDILQLQYIAQNPRLKENQQNPQPQMFKLDDPVYQQDKANAQIMEDQLFKNLDKIKDEKETENKTKLEPEEFYENAQKEYKRFAGKKSRR